VGGYLFERSSPHFVPQNNNGIFNPIGIRTDIALIKNGE
jgi:hypothetical protein